MMASLTSRMMTSSHSEKDTCQFDAAASYFFRSLLTKVVIFRVIFVFKTLCGDLNNYSKEGILYFWGGRQTCFVMKFIVHNLLE